jgi:D-alanine-D-alanine ligase
VLKPVDRGSSVGLAVGRGAGALGGVLAGLDGGRWMVEPRVLGRELTVGVLEGVALGVVEVVPRGGVYDFASKYVPGGVEYRVPAVLPEGVVVEVAGAAVRGAGVCGCRDFARVDFMLGGDGRLVFLEINTMPGLTGTSLLPLCARCAGLGFGALCARMVGPALRRFWGRGG